MTGKRIAFVTQAAPGAFSRISLWLRTAFESLAAPFDVVFLEGPSGTRDFGSTREVRLGVDFARRSIPALVRYMRLQRPHLVVSSPEFLSPYVVVAGRLAGVSVMPWEAALYPQGLEGFPLRKRLFFRALQRRTYPCAPRIACVSRDVAGYLGELLGVSPNSGRFCVVPNPIDRLAIQSQLGNREPISKEAFAFCASGRLNHGKGFDILVEAARLLRDRRPRGWRVNILGRGDQEMNLRRLISSNGLEDVVHLRGFVENPYSVMAASDCFVHSARWEGFGMVLCEAMALGVPVIATNCPGGPAEVLQGGESGLLVAPESPLSLAEGMLHMMDDRLLRQRLASNAQKSLDRYEPELIARRLVEIADEVGRER